MKNGLMTLIILLSMAYSCQAMDQGQGPHVRKLSTNGFADNWDVLQGHWTPKKLGEGNPDFDDLDSDNEMWNRAEPVGNVITTPAQEPDGVQYLLQKYEKNKCTLAAIAVIGAASISAYMTFNILSMLGLVGSD